MTEKKKNRNKTRSEGGQVVVVLNKEMWEALEDVRHQMSRLKGNRVSLPTIARMYLEKGLTADKALPRPPK